MVIFVFKKYWFVLSSNGDYLFNAILEQNVEALTQQNAMLCPSPYGDCLIKRVDYRKENNMQNLAVFPSPSGDYLI